MIEMSSSEAVNETVKRDGVSLRTIHFWLIVGSVMLCGLMFYSTFHLSSSFKHLTETNEQQIELTNAAQELMDASDFLTERVQRFTVKGDRRFLDEYFNEALTAHHREEAIERMGKGQGTNTAYQKLEAAMDMSVKLMDTEYYAMRLVIAAKGITDYPDVLQDVTLTAEDAALDSKQKMKPEIRNYLQYIVDLHDGIDKINNPEDKRQKKKLDPEAAKDLQKVLDDFVKKTGAPVTESFVDDFIGGEYYGT
jgi:CHASE3 domain sensor protein